MSAKSAASGVICWICEEEIGKENLIFMGNYALRGIPNSTPEPFRRLFTMRDKTRLYAQQMRKWNRGRTLTSEEQSPLRVDFV